MKDIKRPSTELVALEAGLDQAEDPRSLKELRSLGVAELAGMIHKRVRQTAITMLQAGRIFCALKEKFAHGEWEKFFAAQGWSWSYYYASVRMLEVFITFPQVLDIPPGPTMRQMLRLPMAEIETLLENTPPEAVKKLTPWHIERVYRQKRDEMRKTNRKKKPIDPAILAQIEKDREDAEWMVFLDAYDAATNALGALSAVKIKPEWRDRIFDRLLLKRLGRVYEKVSKSLHPVEEVLKRAEIVHVAGFAKGRQRATSNRQ